MLIAHRGQGGPRSTERTNASQVNIYADLNFCRESFCTAEETTASFKGGTFGMSPGILPLSIGTIARPELNHFHVEQSWSALPSQSRIFKLLLLAASSCYYRH